MSLNNHHSSEVAVRLLWKTSPDFCGKPSHLPRSLSSSAVSLAEALPADANCRERRDLVGERLNANQHVLNVTLRLIIKHGVLENTRLKSIEIGEKISCWTPDFVRGFPSHVWHRKRFVILGSRTFHVQCPRAHWGLLPVADTQLAAGVMWYIHVLYIYIYTYIYIYISSSTQPTKTGLATPYITWVRYFSAQDPFFRAHM